MHKQNTRFVLAAGILGIIGAVLTLASDLIMLGRLDSAYSFLKLGAETMADISQWRITAGTFLGIFVLPLQIAGLVTVYYGLRPAGKILSLTVVIPIIHALIMGVAFHSSYAFIASGWKLYYKIDQGNANITGMLKEFGYYWKIIGSIILVELLFSSVCYVLMILTRETLYPKWMSLINPFSVLLVIHPLIFSLPAPIGGIIAPTYVNLSNIIFLSFSTIIIYRKLSLKNTSKTLRSY